MSLQKRHAIGNLLFWFQIACASVFCTAQSLKMLKSTQGVSLGFFICHGVFTLLNLSLSIAALRNVSDGERVIKRQSAFIYTTWTLVLLVHIGIALWKMEQLWKTIDTISSVTVALGVIFILGLAKSKNLSLLDPYVKA